jgi:hypothetical protein
MLNFLKWLFGTNYCKGCKHEYLDQYGDMCLYSSPTHENAPQFQIIENGTCNLYESK